MATTAEKLAEARDALHRLQIGQNVLEVRDDGYWVKYEEITVANLREYVNDLQAQLDLENGVTGNGRRPFRLGY